MGRPEADKLRRGADAPIAVFLGKALPCESSFTEQHFGTDRRYGFDATRADDEFPSWHERTNSLLNNKKEKRNKGGISEKERSETCFSLRISFTKGPACCSDR